MIRNRIEQIRSFPQYDGRNGDRNNGFGVNGHSSATRIAPQTDKKLPDKILLEKTFFETLPHSKIKVKLSRLQPDVDDYVSLIRQRDRELGEKRLFERLSVLSHYLGGDREDKTGIKHNPNGQLTIEAHTEIVQAVQDMSDDDISTEYERIFEPKEDKQEETTVFDEKIENATDGQQAQPSDPRSLDEIIEEMLALRPDLRIGVIQPAYVLMPHIAWRGVESKPNEPKTNGRGFLNKIGRIFRR